MEKKQYNSNLVGWIQLKIKVLSKSKNEMKIEIEGAGHSLCNLLQKKLLEDKNVDLAGYDVPHPLTEKAILYLRMIGNSKPETALIRAVNKTLKINEDFRNSLINSLKS